MSSEVFEEIFTNTGRIGPDGSLKKYFLLDPQIVYLNHGAYGATPRPVYESFQRWQLELEREPVDFLSRYFDKRMAFSRQILADYLDTERDNLVYVSNGTTGLNIVARSMPLEPGDEVLTSNHEHGGIDRLWQFMSQKLGFTYINRELPNPLTTHEAFVDYFWAGVTDRTKVILLSHFTSPTALLFPVAEICKRARKQGIITVIDGSHVPGQFPLSLRNIDADFYIGILHKWLCAPKGCAFLYASPAAQSILDPLIVSWGWAPRNPGPSKFVDYHEWQGSRDISEYLSVPDAIEFQKAHNWDQVRIDCKNLARWTQQEISKLTGIPPFNLDTPEWLGQMTCAPLPDHIDPVEVKNKLRFDHNIDVTVDYFQVTPRIRISIQGYNTQNDIEKLLKALKYLI